MRASINLRITLAALCAVLLTPLHAHAQTPEQPSAFGITMGLPLSKLKIRYGGEANTYIVVPPLPNNAFDKYVVKATPEGGVCEVTATSAYTEEDDRFGTSVMARFDALSAKLTEKYGASKQQRTDSFAKNNINSRPEFFILSIVSEERIVADIWSRRSNPALAPGMRSIILRVKAYNWLNPYIELNYAFTNFSDCTPPSPGSRPLNADGL